MVYLEKVDLSEKIKFHFREKVDLLEVNLEMLDLKNAYL